MRVPDNRAVGVFDSGLGGLTAVRELTRLLPREEIVYFGDTARVPYGTRSRETILSYMRQDIAFLMTFDIKALVVACGTASTAGLPLLERDYDFPVVGVVEPAARAAAAATRNGRVGLIGTEAAVGSGAYERALRQIAPGLSVRAQACPLLVPLVENGRGRRGDRVAELVVAEYTDPLRAAGIDTLILGCTHYPLLRDIIADAMGSGVALIDAGREVARRVSEILAEGDALAGRAAPGPGRYFVSDSVEGFARRAALFCPEAINGRVEKVEIDSTTNAFILPAKNGKNC
ncbi:MAG: glutamate racemase [Oscillospiraceae bacterium]|jgi:glutamate racemase|nr:glutamate racemase [Oscillospiraceae bacterium]